MRAFPPGVVRVRLVSGAWHDTICRITPVAGITGRSFGQIQEGRKSGLLLARRRARVSLA
jgi:hypothetical protein